MKIKHKIKEVLKSYSIILVGCLVLAGGVSFVTSTNTQDKFIESLEDQYIEQNISEKLSGKTKDKIKAKIKKMLDKK
ncbi:MAG: hypothetical protein ABIA04_14135 [Pseudomonadota bacterium]